MTALPLPPKPERIRVGGPLRVLIVVEPASLLLRMNEVVRSMPGLELAGGFSSAMDAIEFIVWDRPSWHFAFVDTALSGSSDEVIRRLQAQPRPGTVVALVPHLWQEIRAACAQKGVYEMVEKGDAVAFQDFLEAHLR